MFPKDELRCFDTILTWGSWISATVGRLCALHESAGGIELEILKRFILPSVICSAWNEMKISSLQCCTGFWSSVHHTGVPKSSLVQRQRVGMRPQNSLIVLGVHRHWTYLHKEKTKRRLCSSETNIYGMLVKQCFFFLRVLALRAVKWLLPRPRQNRCCYCDRKGSTTFPISLSEYFRCPFPVFHLYL